MCQARSEVRMHRPTRSRDPHSGAVSALPATYRAAIASIACAFALLGGFARSATATTLTVTTLGDPGPTLQLTLRQAVAMSGSNDTIAFAPGLKGTINLLQGEIVIAHALKITGPGPEVIKVVADAKSRIFHVVNAARLTPF